MEIKNFSLSGNNSCPVPVIVVAAGSSSRMKGINKQLLLLDNIPVIIRTLRAFDNSDAVSRIILVTKESDIANIKSLCDEYNISKLSDIVAGGETRQDSVLAGFSKLSGTEKRL